LPARFFPNHQAESSHGQSAHNAYHCKAVVRHHFDRARPQLEHQQRQHQPANHPPCEHCKHEWDYPHFKHSGGEYKGLPRGGRGQHGGDHHGQELLALEAGSHPLVPLLIYTLEEEQFAASAAQSVGEQAADRRANCGCHNVEQKAALVVPDG
jgi:hypothetical protein